MPGDPLRAKFIAEHYLEGAVLVNEVRGMYAYTGIYQGKPLSVMGSGMGIPSMGIYSYELFDFYDVDRIIRVGSSISFDPQIGLKDVVIGTGSCSESTFGLIQNGYQDEVAYPSMELVERLRKSAASQGLKAYEGMIHCGDVFYRDRTNDAYRRLIEKYHCACGDMESFALFCNAAMTGKEAAVLITISDTAFSKEKLSPEERQNSFDHMIRIALGAL